MRPGACLKREGMRVLRLVPLIVFLTLLSSCGIPSPDNALGGGPGVPLAPGLAPQPAPPKVQQVEADAASQSEATQAPLDEPAASPTPTTPPPPAWVQTVQPAALLSGTSASAQQFSMLPPFSYLQVIGRQGDFLYVVNPKTGGSAYVDAHKVGPSGPPPPFQPFWVESFRPTPLWSGPAAAAAAFGELPPWHFFHVVEPPNGARLHVTVDRTSDVAWIDAVTVGPAGAPTAPAPGFTDVADGGRLDQQLPGWPRLLAQQTQSQLLRPGVVLSNVDLLTEIGSLHLHQLQVDLTSHGISASSVVAHNSVVSTGETVSSMADRTGAIAGINGDYFAIHDSGIPLNLTIQNGNLIRSGNDWAVFGVTKNNQVDIGKYAWRGVLSVLGNPTLWFPIEGVNLPLVDGRVVAVTESMGSPLAASNATLAYLSPVPGTSNRYLVRRVLEGQSSVPPVSGNTVMLAGEGVGATWLAQYAPKATQLQLDYRSVPNWRELQTAVGGGPILVKNGAPFQDGDAPASFEANVPYPVSGAGVSRDGRTLWLVVVDGHEGYPAFGLTRSQFAWYFQTIGAWQAMAFDSGGSATLVARLRGQRSATVVNAPSDGQERSVADGLFIYG